MIMDKQNMLSEAQAITASAASTNVIDLGAKHAYVQNQPEYGMGKLLAQVITAFDNLTSLTIALRTDDNAGMASPTTLKSEVVLLADLVAGKQVAFDIPKEAEQYVDFYYTVTGTNPANGKITAGFVLDRQTANV